MSLIRLVALAAVALAGCQAPLASGETAQQNDGFQRWLVPYLRDEYRDLPEHVDPAGVTYSYALVDLNDVGPTRRSPMSPEGCYAALAVAV